MPWFYRYPRWRRRRAWRRRSRGLFRRRLWRKRWRRHRYRVRRKLPFLTLKEWQPKRIQKLKITGTLPLYATTSERVANNMRLYEDEISPHFVPSLGGFSITQFTLKALYQLFQRGRAWWTQSNTDLPLIRYTGCTMKFYRAESSDYIVLYHNCFPMIPNLDTYNSTQPTIMQLNNKHKILRCKKHNYIKKPYTKVHIKPPSQMTNKWFFQKELADVPLVLLMASAMSLDRWYLNSTSVSSSLGFLSLNTSLFKYHNWATPTSHGYHPQDGIYLWTFQQTFTPPTQFSITSIQYKNLIYLGRTDLWQPGVTINDTPAHLLPQGTQQDWQKKRDTYANNSGLWGNLFIPPYFTNPKYPILSAKFGAASLTQKYTTENQNLEEENFQILEHPLVIQCRYNPFPDDGIENKIYFTSITELVQNWSPPVDLTLQRNSLPLWLGLWGLIDFQKVTKDPTTIDTLKVITIVTKYIKPPLTHYVPIDQDFINGNSPYRPKQPPTASDQSNWHPKVTFQYQTINAICVSGPATIKLPPKISTEAHVNFKFYFKLGGCAAPIKTIDDPEKQPEFPVPNNILHSTSLQSPDIPYQNFLYSFDWRRHLIKEKAIQRIQKYSEPETTALSSTGINYFNPQAAPDERTSETDSSEEEKEKETLLLLLRQYKFRQQQYKRRILQLMQSLE
nr:MAG: ORF1 [TTV-like mini virus]